MRAQTLAGLSERQKCFTILKDLERTFINLSTLHKWEGVGHDGAAFRFTNETLVATAARKQMQFGFDEWVKNKICHGCGKKGHIKRRCPERGRTRSRDTSRK